MTGTVSDVKCLNAVSFNAANYERTVSSRESRFPFTNSNGADGCPLGSEKTQQKNTWAVKNDLNSARKKTDGVHVISEILRHGDVELIERNFKVWSLQAITGIRLHSIQTKQWPQPNLLTSATISNN